MELRFTKGSGKTDHLEIRRTDGSVAHIDCPKQRIIPHDMVHYAVESVLTARGFLGRVHAGEAAAFTMGSADESDGVERLVEAMQGEAWSGTSDSAAVIDLYSVTCEARGCPMLAIDEAGIDAIRHAINDLTVRWEAVPVGGVLVLNFGAQSSQSGTRSAPMMAAAGIRSATTA
jgi:hypothetical protein